MFNLYGLVYRSCELGGTAIVFMVENISFLEHLILHSNGILE